MENLSILLPFRSDNGGFRDHVFQWLKQHYEIKFPGAELCISGDNPTNRLFNKSQAINACARKATRDIFLIADADMWYEPYIIQEALSRIYDYSWVIPYSTIYHISEEDTRNLLQMNIMNGRPISDKWLKVVDAEVSNIVGGINMITREKFEQIGGFDERFQGYGGEDDAFAILVNTMYGAYTRFNHRIFHLWHPPSSPDLNPNYSSNFQLYCRYAEANGDKKKMMQLVKENKGVVDH